MKLYHYVHCPFCIRVRLVLGYFSHSYESIVLPYNDEKTPLSLAGKKMLPIMDFGSDAINESLDIIARLDHKNKLLTLEARSHYEKTEKILNEWGENVHSMAMPYFIWTPEFNHDSREYFQKKKEMKRGPFKDLVKKRSHFEKNLNLSLKSNKHYFEKEINRDTLNLDDILIASHLWAMYIVPEYQFEDKVHTFLQAVKEACHFEYHQDYWR